MAGSLAEENIGSANAIYFTVKRILFNPMTLKIGKVELMHVHKMSARMHFRI